MTEKIDYKKILNPFYSASTKEPEIVDVPALNFLMIDGRGDPNVSPEYKEAVSALFSLAYALKFHIKKTLSIDYGVMPLEGLWWSEDMTDFLSGAKERWLWTMMILQPEWVSAEMAARLRGETSTKKDMPLINKIRFETYREGTSVQLMHIGPFSEEGPNVARTHAYAEEHGYQRSGKHHEIYLSDFTRTAPGKLRTILRQPLKKLN